MEGLLSTGPTPSSYIYCFVLWTTGKRVNNRRQSRGQAAKSRTGKKIHKRFQSPEQVANVRTGVKADNMQESQQQVLKPRQQARKPSTCNKVEDR